MDILSGVIFSIAIQCVPEPNSQTLEIFEQRFDQILEAEQDHENWRLVFLVNKGEQLFSFMALNKHQPMSCLLHTTEPELLPKKVKGVPAQF